MESHHHALHAGLLAIGILAVSPPSVHPALLVGVVLLLGVGIDADHFLVARLNTGSWKNLRRVLRDPGLVLFDQTAIFDPLDVWGEDRLLSHLLLAGSTVGVLWAVGRTYWAGVAAATLYVHLLADVYAGVRRREQRAIEHATALEAEREAAG